MDKYKEALEKARAGKSIEEIFPELKESEDERIRNRLIEAIKSSAQFEDAIQRLGLSWPSVLAWLEKQKENPKSNDFIPSDCVSDVKCEDRWHKVADSFPNSSREVICKDAIGNFFIGRYYKGSNSWEVSMYDDIDKSNEDNPPVVMWCDIPSEKQKEQKPILSAEESLGISQEEYNKIVDECIYGEQKEQKLADDKDFEDKTVNVRMITDSETGEKYPFVSYKDQLQKPAEWSEEEVGHLYTLARYIKSKGYEDDGEFLEGVANKLKRIRPQPKQEWSEEDINMFGSILSTLSVYSNNPDIPVEIREIHKKEYAWFDDLYNRVSPQPHWKPSEEQMKQLDAVINAYSKGSMTHKVLDSLYEQLKSL